MAPVMKEQVLWNSQGFMRSPDIERAMDLLTMGYRTDKEVKELLGEQVWQKAVDALNEDYSYDHIPWNAKRWKPLDVLGKERHDARWPNVNS